MSHDPNMEMKIVERDGTSITITPMQPLEHDLLCEWYVDRVPDSEPGPVRAAGGETSDGPKLPEGMGGFTNGLRGFRRDGKMYEYPPLGAVSALAKVDPKTKTQGIRFVLPVSELPRGRYIVTCRVWDPTPWVLKDPQKLLEERATFWVTVAPAKK
jgi:hypothetical protein